MDEKLSTAILKSAKSIYSSLPVLLEVIFLVGLISAIIPKAIKGIKFMELYNIDVREALKEMK